MCPEETRRSLVAVLEQGVGRPSHLNLPDSAAGARFPQLCLRKLYVISSRGGGPGNTDDCLEEVYNKYMTYLCCKWKERDVFKHDDGMRAIPKF